MVWWYFSITLRLNSCTLLPEGTPSALEAAVWAGWVSDVVDDETVEASILVAEIRGGVGCGKIMEAEVMREAGVVLVVIVVILGGAVGLDWTE